jgi:deoxyribodipyrimidine photolyase-related protein
MKLIIILCNQLYEDSPILEDLEKDDIIVLYEHPVYFTDFKYHKMKLVMHRATTKYYYDYMEDNYKNKIIYLEYNGDILKEIKKHKNLELLKVYNPIDHKIVKEYINISKKLDIELEIINNPGFICTIEDYDDYLKNNKNKNPYFHHSFYIWCRRKYNLLMNKDKPIGNKWSFDTENRIPFPKNYKEDEKQILVNLDKNKHIKEAKQYVDKNFKKNHGSDDYYLPIDFKGAKKHFETFLKKRLNNFGPYEDAVSNEIIFGNHSVLSPLINIGLITPNYILEKVSEYFEKSKPKIQSVEGYIRQLFWREFCALVYLNKNKELESGNFFNHKKDLDNSWYDGTTNMELINDIIKKALNYGWIHHIERLMYIGNFMLITKIKPKDTYKWFMELFIDAYPWVMSPNVYGMSQHSAGQIMMKRPYFSSSNYIDKMSTYKKKNNIYNKIKIEDVELEWFEVWDALYYNFINDNKKYLEDNYSTANIVRIWNKKTNKEKENILEISKNYLSKY